MPNNLTGQGGGAGVDKKGGNVETLFQATLEPDLLQTNLVFLFDNLFQPCGFRCKVSFC